MNKYRIPAAFGLTALILSLIYTHHTVGWSNQPLHRLDIYPSYALNLLEGYGYGDCQVGTTLHCVDEGPDRITNRAYRLPGYPTFIAGLLVIFGTENLIAPVLMMQSILSASMVGVTVFIVQRYGYGFGIVAGILFLLSAGIYVFSSLVMTEVVFSVQLLVFAVTIAKAKNAPHYFLAGILLGVMMLTRGVLLFTIPLLYFVVKGKRHYAVMLITALLVIMPWTVRNYLVLDAFVPFSTGSGQVLYGSWHPDVVAYAPGTWVSSRHLSDEFLNMAELERDQALRESAIAFIRDMDIRYLIAVLLFKAIAFWGLYDPLIWNVISSIMLVTWCIVLYRVIRVRRLRSIMREALQVKWIQISIVLLLGAVMNTMVFWGGTRFLFPYSPYMITLSVMGLWILTQANKRSTEVVVTTNAPINQL